VTNREKAEGPQDHRLQEAIRGALETAAETGWHRGRTHEVVEATLSMLDEKLGVDATGVQYTVESAPDHCLVVAHSSDPAAMEVVASFMHHGGATALGSHEVWLLPLDGVPVNRWLRALRRVVAAEQRAKNEESASPPVRLTAVWARDDELMVSNVK
jgi:hypothetical protein